MNKKKTFCDILFGENSEEQQFEEFSSVEANIARSIRDKYIDYCYNLNMLPKIQAECEKRKCFFAYEIEIDNDGNLDYIKLIPVTPVRIKTKQKAFCELKNLPKSYKINYVQEK